ncbi:MAG: sugar nucleotide-binding protein [Akkermansiaceae bacterium]|nr:sugar nucleotide-binding protein [Akkermansiaceae bacterium]
MKLLLLGHGYLGEAVVSRFRDAGWEVQPVSKSGDGEAMACDVSDAAAVQALPDADAVVHCAASGRGGGAEAYQKVYVDGCRHLADRYPDQPLLFTSSSSVYGQTDGSVVTEESPTEPNRETGELLLAAEAVVRENGGVVARLSGIYGPGRSVILKKFLNGDAVIEEDGRRYLNQIHRDDAAEAVFKLIDSGAMGIFNVCDSQPLTQKQCYEALSEHFDRPLPPTGPRDLQRKRGWTHKQVSNAKLLKTGWKPRFPCFLDAVPSVAQTL